MALRAQAKIGWSIMVLLSALPRESYGLGWSGQTPAPPARVQQTAPAAGYFEGKSYQLGFYAGSMLGYESNYQLLASDTVGSALLALETGIELRYRPTSSALKLRGNLGGALRLPFSAGGLTELSLELPVWGAYALTSRLELVFANFLSLAREKTPPIFLDLPSSSGDPSGGQQTMRYFSLSEEVYGALAYHLLPQLQLEVGPYVRVKQVDFLGETVDAELDHLFGDLGFQLSLKAFFGQRLSARLKYDFARRFFSDHPARPPADYPSLGESLRMNRHLISLLLRATVYGPFSALLGYGLRFNGDNGGFFDYRQHQGRLGLTLQWPELLSLSAGLSYVHRTYTNRTPCAAFEEVEGSGIIVGSDCQVAAEKQIPLEQQESALLFDFSASYLLKDPVELVLSYAMEHASTDLATLLSPNHRILIGAGISY